MLSVVFAQTTAQAMSEKEIWDIAFAALAVVGSVLAAIGAIIAFFLMRYWAKRDRDADAREREQAAKDAERARHRDILYESLKWFEGGTQKRSIGIAVVNTSWPMFEEFRPLWVEVFANQAIYLLTVSDQKDKPHEHDNLRRIMEVVIREHSLLQPESYRIVLHTIEEKLKGQPSGGLTLTEELKARLSNWKNEISRRT